MARAFLLGEYKLERTKMNNFSWRIIAYFVAIPLALVLGYLVATPDLASVATLGFVLLCLALPLIIKWHHALVIITWNSAISLGFLQGQPRLWLILGGASFAIAVLNRVIGLKSFIRAPELTKPILALSGVVVLTAVVRGGVGARIFGGSGYGGKGYIYALGAILGYFALTGQKVPLPQSERMVKWFFLSALTFGLSNLVYALGPGYYLLYNLVPADVVNSQVANDWGLDVVQRYEGLQSAATGCLCFILARWGLRGVLAWNKPWRLLLLVATLAAGLFSGFRSAFALLCVLLAVQFFYEGLWKTAYLPALLLTGVLCLTPLLLFANKMPRAVQRTLALLPVDIDPNVRDEATSSSEWRVQMWRAVWPDVPRYLLLGRGYSIDPAELYLTEQAARSGLLATYEISIVAGDYHSGPLSVLIPFGLMGACAFIWLLVAGTRALYCNYRFGDARLKQVNTVLLSYFLAQSLFFFFVFGAFSSQLVVFLGILGLSVSLNNGVCHKLALKVVPGPAPAAVMLEPA